VSPLHIVDGLLRLFQLLVFVRALWSWVDRHPFSDNPAKRVLWQVTEPLLDPIRRIVPPVGGAVDISPWIAIVALQVLEQILLQAAAH
jgi:YggT family protein